MVSAPEPTCIIKAKCTAAVPHVGVDEKQTQELVILRPTSIADGKDQEWSSIPTGQLQFHFNNPTAFGRFKSGKSYVVTIVEE